MYGTMCAAATARQYSEWIQSTSVVKMEDSGAAVTFPLNFYESPNNSFHGFLKSLLMNNV